LRDGGRWRRHLPPAGGLRFVSLAPRRSGARLKHNPVDNMKTDVLLKPRSRLLLYGATILLSAFLLFQIQPLVGRIVLPLFGGVASVWTTCMLFFQGLLLVGYLYAHGLTHLAQAAQRLVHGAVLLAGIAALFSGLSASPSIVEGDPTWAVLRTLFVLVGLPYLILSATGPLLQAWWLAEADRTPYRLFALSNFGSLLALLSYPLLVEPRLALGTQASAWTVGFVIFAVAIGAVAYSLPRLQRPAMHARARNSEAPTRRDAAIWTVLAFCPSLLLLAVTRHITEDIAPVPLLWVVFLCVYLSSFVLCFERDGWYRRKVFVPALFLSMGLISYSLLTRHVLFGPRGTIVVYTLALFAASMTCHGELARRKPAPEHLTRFYLWVAVGGVLGGVFVSIIAPRIFNDYYELPLGLVLALLVAALSSPRVDPRPPARLRKVGLRGALIALTLCVAAALAYESAERDERFVLLRRNFYGRLAIKHTKVGEVVQRTLYHGGTIHGLELLDGTHRLQPTTYYTESSGIGRALLGKRRSGAQQVGVIGLGAGTLATYARPDDLYRFYEINPLVVRVARRWFFFLARCKGQVEIALGDARLSLQREADARFDVLAVDAFSGDAIPVHLLTREAFELYFARVKPNGILAVHVSNRYLDLVPVVATHAAQMGKHALIFDTQEDRAKLQYGSTWVLLADSAAVFADPIFRGGQLPNTVRSVRQWTDDYSSVFEVLK